jgi:cyclohexanone monooxygenase
VSANSSTRKPMRSDVLVVGAGFAGMYLIWKMREFGLSVRGVERGGGVGGTWYWNRYPGLRCDAESLDYSYSFSDELQQEWEWSERFPAQPDILRYLDHVADRFDLRRDIDFGTEVLSAAYDEADNVWSVETDRGGIYRARYLVMATGALSKPQEPPFPSLDAFTGEWYQTSRWPHDAVQLAGKRVGLIGTGSTGIQFATAVAPEVEHLFVFQRTANYSVPARNRPLDPGMAAEYKRNYAAHRESARYSGGGTAIDEYYDEPGYGPPPEPQEISALSVGDEERRAEYERRWRYGGAPEVLAVYADLMVSDEANETLSEFVREQIRAIVEDPDTAELLCPNTHPLGTKRICVDTGYFEIFNRPNVTLVDVRSAPIAEITETGLRLADGQEFELDVIVFAIGFDALTGALLDVDIRGTEARSLRELWKDGPRSYLGLAVAGFPNLFTITGPNSPSVLSNVVTSIEQHVELVSDLIAHARDRGADRIEPTQRAQDDWVEHVNFVASHTLFPKAASWYMGANIPGKPRIMLPYVGGVGNYRKTCEEIAADGYRGFEFSRGESRVAA